MARIRSIKPEFWTSEQLAECSRDARLMFVGIWSFADDNGVHSANPKRIKMQIYPADDICSVNIQEWLDELLANDLLVFYEIDGKPYIQVTGWHHQKIDQPTYRHPLPNGDLPETPGRRRTKGGVHRTDGKGSHGEWSGEERKGKEKDNPQTPLPEWLSKSAWGEYEQHRKEKRSNLTPLARTKAIAKLERLRGEGHEPADVIRHTIENGWAGLFPEDQKTQVERKTWQLSEPELLSRCEELQISTQGRTAKDLVAAIEAAT